MPGINYAHVIELPQAWIAKDEAIIYFKYKLHRLLFQKLLKEFKDGSGYRLVTSNMSIINIKLFVEFLVEFDKNKYSA
ncbi:hypothetical protein ABH902_001591 [Enterococcus sp. UD-01]|jgi:hypothetical protein